MASQRGALARRNSHKRKRSWCMMKFRPLIVDYYSEAHSRLAEEQDRIRGQTLFLPQPANQESGQGPDPNSSIPTPAEESIPSPSDQPPPHVSPERDTLEPESDGESPTEGGKLRDYNAENACHLLEPSIRPDECVKREIAEIPSVEEFRSRVLQAANKNGGVIQTLPSTIDSVFREGSGISLFDRQYQEPGMRLSHKVPLFSSSQPIPSALYCEAVSADRDEKCGFEVSSSHNTGQWKAYVQECCMSRSPFLRHTPEESLLPTDLQVQKSPLRTTSPLPDKSLVDIYLKRRRVEPTRIEKEDTLLEFLNRWSLLDCFQLPVHSLKDLEHLGSMESFSELPATVDALRIMSPFPCSAFKHPKEREGNHFEMSDDKDMPSWYALNNKGKPFPTDYSCTFQDKALTVDPEFPMVLNEARGELKSQDTVAQAEKMTRSTETELVLETLRISDYRLHNKAASRTFPTAPESLKGMQDLPMPGLEAVANEQSLSSDRHPVSTEDTSALVSVTEPSFNVARVDFDLKLPTSDFEGKDEQEPPVGNIVSTEDLVFRAWGGKLCKKPGIQSRNKRLVRKSFDPREARLFSATDASAFNLFMRMPLVRHYRSICAMPFPHLLAGRSSPMEVSSDVESDRLRGLSSRSVVDKLRGFVQAKLSKDETTNLQISVGKYPLWSWSEPFSWIRNESESRESESSHQILQAFRSKNSKKSLSEKSKNSILTGCVGHRDEIKLKYRGFISGAAVDPELYEIRYHRMLRLLGSNPPVRKACQPNPPLLLESTLWLVLFLYQCSFSTVQQSEPRITRALPRSPNRNKKGTSKRRRREKGHASSVEDFKSFVAQSCFSVFTRLGVETMDGLCCGTDLLTIGGNTTARLFDSMECAGRTSVSVRIELLHLFDKAVQLSQPEQSFQVKQDSLDSEDDYSWIIQRADAHISRDPMPASEDGDKGKTVNQSTLDIGKMKPISTGKRRSEETSENGSRGEQNWNKKKRKRKRKKEKKRKKRKKRPAPRSPRKKKHKRSRKISTEHFRDRSESCGKTMPSSSSLGAQAIISASVPACTEPDISSGSAAKVAAWDTSAKSPSILGASDYAGAGSSVIRSKPAGDRNKDPGELQAWADPDVGLPSQAVDRTHKRSSILPSGANSMPVSANYNLRPVQLHETYQISQYRELGLAGVTSSLQDRTGRLVADTEIPAVKILCSESFLESWGQVVSELASGNWTASFACNVDATPAFLDAPPEAPIVGRKISVVDCPLIDFAGVDFELSGRGSIIICRLSSWTSESSSKAFVTKVIQLASVRRYERIDVLLCADVEITPAASEDIALLQNSVIHQTDAQQSRVQYQIVSPQSISAAIAHRVLTSAGPAHSEMETLMGQEVLQPSFLERARFLFSVVPTLTVCGALQCLNISARTGGPDASRGDSGFSSTSLQLLLSGTDEGEAIASIRKLVDSNKSEVTTQAFQQLCYVATTALSNDC